MKLLITILNGCSNTDMKNFSNKKPILDLFNFFEGTAQLIANQGEQAIKLEEITASAHSEVSTKYNPRIGFGAVVSDMIDGTLDASDDIIFTLDPGYSNYHRLVFLKTDNNSPILEVFYSR